MAAVPPLDVDALVADAVDATGLEDFGPWPWRDGLEVLVDSINREASLTSMGSLVMTARLGNSLQQRLGVVDWMARHPEIAEVPIEGPVLVTGLPRTGTTALSNLMGCDPDTRAPRVWETATPVPPPEAATYLTDPRIAQTQAGIDYLHGISPIMRVLHDDEATSVAEHMDLLCLSFRAYHYSGMVTVPTYLDWWLEQDLRSTYDLHRRVTQLLGWRCPPRRWHIRNPPDLFCLDAVVDAYPEVRIVWTHRDPARVMASVCELIAVVRELSSDAVDRRALGAHELELWGVAAERAVAARERLGEERFIDVWHSEFVADPVAALAGVYDRVGWAFTGAAEAGARHWVEGHGREQHGTHDPQLADFGLTAEGVRDRFAAYCERFGV